MNKPLWYKDFRLYWYEPTQKSQKEHQQLIFFSPANGIPAQTYQSFLRQWCERTETTIVTYDFRGMGQTQTPHTFQAEWGWPILLKDALEIFAYVQDLLPETAAIWAGHSLGAWLCLWAAEPLQAQYPIILFDPPLLPPKVTLGWLLLQALDLKEKNFHSQQALRRKASYQNHEEAKEKLLGKAFFKHWNKPAVESYIKGSFYTEVDGRLTLRHSPLWESHLFASYPPLASFGILKKLSAKTRENLKGVIIAGDHSNACYLPSRFWFQRLLPQLKWKILSQATHMFPFEQEKETLECLDKAPIKF